MKHNVKITAILLIMFLIAQLIGLAVVNVYSPKQTEILNQTTGKLENITIQQDLPYGMQPPEMKPEFSLTSIIIAFIIAIVLILILMNLKATIFLRLWFFIVVIIALAIALNSAIINIQYSQYIALVIAIPLAFLKIFKRNLLVHNLTELLIYPGIAAVFVPILNLWAIVILLLLISVYDIYAVWHAGFMQKMAKFQITKLKLFAGFFIPYASKKARVQIEKIQKLKSKKEKEKRAKKIKVSLAILGGGDVVFPIILAGVVLRAMGLIPALIISVTATLALLALFIAARKGKFYPAMPFITAGCLIGLALGFLF